MTTVIEMHNPLVGSYPPEIDVYKDPHLRMKSLINSTIETVSHMQEALNLATSKLEDILQSVYGIMWEFKSHEFIENTFIMDRLRARLSAQQVYNKLVCNCHNDSQLVNIIGLVELVYAADNDFDRLHNGELLQVALSEFVKDMMPHMEEEETIFLPLLTKYFDYEELKELKVTVLEQHKLWKEKLGSEKNLKKVKDLQNEEMRNRLYLEIHELETPEVKVDPYCKELENLRFDETTTIDDLPEEILNIIFEFLNPRELMKVGSVAKIWRIASKRKPLWRNILASQWLRGHWSFQEELLDKDAAVSVDVSDMSNKLFDEDADVDESDFLEEDFSSSEDQETESRSKEVAFYNGLIRHHLPEVGDGVTKLVVSGSSTISSQQLRKMIKLCPRLEVLDCSYTNISDAAFKGISSETSLKELRKVDLTGCTQLTDTAIERILSCFVSYRKQNVTPKVWWVSVSGCKGLTDKSLGYMDVLKNSLEYLDLSGCSRMSGPRMKSFVKSCTKLVPENLSYCNLVEDGPYLEEANGCQNLDCPLRSCCINGSN